jgi:hypothetical protein
MTPRPADSAAVAGGTRVLPQLSRREDGQHSGARPTPPAGRTKLLPPERRPHDKDRKPRRPVEIGADRSLFWSWFFAAAIGTAAIGTGLILLLSR